MAPHDFHDLSDPSGQAARAVPENLDQPSDTGSASGRDTLSAELSVLASDAAARERFRSASLHRQAAEEGTFAGVLADLAERGRPVVLRLQNGRHHRGKIRLVGDDVVVLARDVDGAVLIARCAIASVQTLPGDSTTIGDRWIDAPGTLAAALQELVDERSDVLVVGLDASITIRGQLRAVGLDVLTIRPLDGAPGAGLVYVPLAAVAEVSVLVVSG